MLIIGGKGKTGRRVVSRLEERGVNVRIGSRSAEPPFDWEEPETWPAALADMEAVYVTYYPDLAFPGVPELLAAFGARAREAGVRKLVLLSGRGEEGAVASERAIQDAGLAWTVLRCNWFNQNFDESFFLDSVRAGVLTIPAGDAREPFIDADDIADVAVAALTDSAHDGQIYELSGPRLLSFDEVAEELSAATGRAIVYESVTTEEYRALLIEQDLPLDFAELFEIILDGRNANVADGVSRALGREPRDFREYAVEAAATGVWN